jgi:signal transduction histidine kinase/ligand-binding sensor domain-containing protein/DNA-binding response OmpR family regulator
MGRRLSLALRCLVGALALVRAASPAAAQGTRPAPSDDTLWTRSLGVEDGLSQNYALAIAQDRYGFLWFGTVSGLNRWDGYQFESHASVAADPASLSASLVLALHADRAGNVWVGTPEGIDRFVEDANAFERHGALLRSLNGGRRVPVETIASDRAGRVWFAAFGESSIFRLTPRTGDLRAFAVPSASGLRVAALLVDDDDRLWVSMTSGGDGAPAPRARRALLMFDRCSDIGDEGLPAPRTPVSLADDGAEAGAIVMDRAHRVWVGRTGGLLLYDPSTGVVVRTHGGAAGAHPLAGLVVRSLAPGPSGEIWILAHAPDPAPGDEPHALFRMDPDTLQARRITLRDEAGRRMADARLERVFVDRSGVLWLSSNAGGLRYADVSAGGFSLYRRQAAGEPGLAGSFVRAVVKTRDDVVWVGTQRGLTRMERSGGRVVYGAPFSTRGAALPDPSVQSLLEDRDGNLWIGTPRGLVVVERASGAVRRYRRESGDPRSLAEDWVGVLHEDRDGRVWVGTLGRGLSEFDPGTRSFRNYGSRPNDAAGLPSGAITAIFTDGANRLWIGTDNGLARLASSADSTRRFEEVAAGAGGLGGVVVQSIAQSAATPDVLWIGTEQRGLARLDLRDESVRFLTTRNSGLPDDTVYGLLTDEQGRLWMSTNRGLASFDPSANAFRSYGAERGLQSSEFNARAFFRAADGEMFFGGIGGLTAFYPDRIADNPHSPAVVISAVRVLDRGARVPGTEARLLYGHGLEQQSVEVEHDERDITFDFVALHFSDAARNRYFYRLDGYDADWRGPGAQRTAQYTNLDPGHYTFRVKALSSHGVPSDGEATFSFVVLPPFYATAWFRALAALSIVLALAGGYRLRVRGMRRRQQDLQREVAQRTEELRRALETVEGQARQLKELDAAKSRFFANISHEFRTPLTLTLGPLRDVRAGMHGTIPDGARAEIDLAIENARRQLELVDQLLALARLDAGQPEFGPRESRLDECVRLAAAPYESLAKRQRTRLSLDLPAVSVRGAFDEEKIGRVIGNLLGNALKFTPPGGDVALRLRAAPDGWATIEVADTGPGIPAHDLPHVFERFYRGEQAGRQVPGTGIGLALAKEYVDLHGGEIRAERRAGGGTRVTVRLPAVAAHHGTSVREAAPEGEARGGTGVTPAADEVSSGPVTVPAPADAEGADLPRVLVVDDHADMRAYLRKHLTRHYEVLEAARGDEALAQIGVEIPDVIVSDVMMPGLDGYALCRAVKASPDTDFIPVVLLTAKAGAESRLDGLEGGADDYLAKPFEPAELLARVRNLLLARERLKARFAARPPTPGLAPTSLPRQSPDEAFLTRLQLVLDQQSHDEAFDVAALAAELGASRAQLHRQVRKVLDSTPAETIIQFRLQRAARMLADRAGNVGEVAYAVGFKNLSHFVKRFREQYGQTPASYAASRHGKPQTPVGS